MAKEEKEAVEQEDDGSKAAKLPWVVVLLVVAFGAGVARRVNPWSAIQRVDRKARVIGNGRQARCRDGVLRLDQRVFDKGCARFVGVAYAKLRLRHDLDVEVAEYSFDFPELASIAAGHDDLALEC